MAITIDRPLSLTPSLGSLFGNERSKKMIQSAHDEGFKNFCELINDGWEREHAIRTAHMIVIGSLQSNVHQLASEVAGDE